MMVLRFMARAIFWVGAVLLYVMGAILAGIIGAGRN
jgi:hypothetical protein